MSGLLTANIQNLSLRQPYIGREVDVYDPNNKIKVEDRNYPLVTLYDCPSLDYYAVRDADQESIETQSVGSSASSTTGKPEEYRISGKKTFLFSNFLVETTQTNTRRPVFKL